MREFDRLRFNWHVAALRFEVAALRHWMLLRKAGFRPDQPRDEDGKWVAEGNEAGKVQFAQLQSGVTDAFGAPYYQPGGHHEMPVAVYSKWNLPAETRAVFNKSTTGSVPAALLRTAPDGTPTGHLWNGPNGAHRYYNDAVRELSEDFMRRENISPERMTPDQARALLKEIRETSDPRIRNYNSTIRMLRRLIPLRSGRGNE